MAESYEAGESVSAVARRRLVPAAAFAWRGAAVADAAPSESMFVPALVDAPTPQPVMKRPSRPRRKKASREAGMIELEIDGVALRVGRGADAKTITAVIRALKATT